MVEPSLREVLGISKKEFHDSIMDLVKRKQLSTQLVEVRAVRIDEVTTEDEWSDNHYMKPYWARAITETPLRIVDVKEPVVAWIDHGSEINRISTDFYNKGKWPINTKHGRKIRAAIHSTQ